jgi:DNA-binding LacI/PurR family transcriptional regulator
MADYHESRERLQRLVEQGTRFVCWGAAVPDQPGVSIGSDKLQSGFDITAHLLDQGCQCIALIGYASNHYPSSRSPTADMWPRRRHAVRRARYSSLGS